MSLFMHIASKVRFIITVLLLFAAYVPAQVKPDVTLIGGDKNPKLKDIIEKKLEMILLEVNRQKKGTGNIEALKSQFNEEAYKVFSGFVLKNKAYTARRSYEAQMVERLSGRSYDIRSITMKVELGQTESADNQSLVFTFSKEGLITSVRTVLVNHDYHEMISKGSSRLDSLTREKILDFVEQFRMAYNSKDIDFLEKIYSDDALIITGSVLRQKPSGSEMMNRSLLTKDKINLLQQTKKEYLEALRNKAFKLNSYLDVRFQDLAVIQHEKIPYIYGISCWQYWNSAGYSDKGYLFLMMDFRNQSEPVIHVRTWQPEAFSEDNEFISLYDFDVVTY